MNSFIQGFLLMRSAAMIWFSAMFTKSELLSTLFIRIFWEII